MKIRITMKDPDGPYEAVRDAVNESVAGVTDEEERESLRGVRTKKANTAIRKWLGYGEYITFTIDTEADTCVVERDRG